MNKQDILFTPYQLNQGLTLKNRIIMAPMTRAKATDELIPTSAMSHYYARRANAGLLITEATVIEPNGLGYNNAPGIFTASQIKHWRHVTDTVHQNHGLIFTQIWHAGRVSHPKLLNGNLPISASATTMSNRVPRTSDLTYGSSRAATLDEIAALIATYAQAAKNAINAGFDGVEIHGANGYLIDQFLHYDTNKRSDEYGGSPENMARFALEVVKACGDAIGYDRVGLRLSPGGYLHEIKGVPYDAHVFKYLLQQLNSLHIAYVHIGNNDDSVTFTELGNLQMSSFVRAHYQGTLIGCGSYTIASAREAMQQNKFDLIAIGRPFIANHDLIEKIQNQIALQIYDRSMLVTLY